MFPQNSYFISFIVQEKIVFVTNSDCFYVPMGCLRGGYVCFNVAQFHNSMKTNMDLQRNFKNLCGPRKMTNDY